MKILSIWKNIQNIVVFNKIMSYFIKIYYLLPWEISLLNLSMCFDLNMSPVFIYWDQQKIGNHYKLNVLENLNNILLNTASLFFETKSNKAPWISSDKKYTNPRENILSEKGSK